MPQVKVLVLDDINYLLTYDTFDKANEKGYEKFTNQEYIFQYNLNVVIIKKEGAHYVKKEL